MRRFLVLWLATALGFAPPMHVTRSTRLFETTVDLVDARIREALETTDLQISTADDDPNGMHVSLYVVSPKFEGLTRVKRQQEVYRAIKDLMGSGQIHAVDTLTTKAPSEV